MISVPLTSDELKTLRYSCRPAILLSIFVFFIGILGFIYTASLAGVKTLNSHESGYVYFSALILTCYLIPTIGNRKLKADILNGYKEIITKPLQKKENGIDHEAGSGMFSLDGKMKAKPCWFFIIDNYRYPVEQEEFDLANEGDLVLLHFAPKSRELFKIEITR